MVGEDSRNSLNDCEMKWTETTILWFCFLLRLFTFKHSDLQSSSVLSFSFRSATLLASPSCLPLRFFSKWNEQLNLKKPKLFQSLGWDFNQIKVRKFMVKVPMVNIHSLPS
jgi:hypothetical protein